MHGFSLHGFKFKIQHYFLIVISLVGTSTTDSTGSTRDVGSFFFLTTVDGGRTTYTSLGCTKPLEKWWDKRAQPHLVRAIKMIPTLYCLLNCWVMPRTSHENNHSALEVSGAYQWTTELFKEDSSSAASPCVYNARLDFMWDGWNQWRVLGWMGFAWYDSGVEVSLIQDGSQYEAYRFVCRFQGLKFQKF